MRLLHTTTGSAPKNSDHKSAANKFAGEDERPVAVLGNGGNRSSKNLSFRGEHRGGNGGLAARNAGFAIGENRCSGCACRIMAYAWPATAWRQGGAVVPGFDAGIRTTAKNAAATIPRRLAGETVHRNQIPTCHRPCMKVRTLRRAVYGGGGCGRASGQTPIVSQATSFA